jgi:RimJ/RimL family protein N-acetyltransferase
MAKFPEKVVRLGGGGAELQLRSAVAADARAYRAFMGEVFRDGEGMIFSLDEYAARETQESVRKQIETQAAHESGLILLAWERDRLLGELTLQSGKPRSRRHAAVLGISLATSARGLGLGALMLGEALDFVRVKTRLERIELGVLADNHRARALYRKFGFVEEGCRRGAFKFESGERVDDIAMALHIQR